jgi:hypothetical protein
LFDVLVAEFRAHSAIVVVPLHCFWYFQYHFSAAFQPSLLLSAARSAHAARHSRDTRANFALQYRARIVTTCHFVAKMLTIEEFFLERAAFVTEANS